VIDLFVLWRPLFVTTERAFLTRSVCRALLNVFRALLSACRALLLTGMAQLSARKALFAISVFFSPGSKDWEVQLQYFLSLQPFNSSFDQFLGGF